MAESNHNFDYAAKYSLKNQHKLFTAFDFIIIKTYAFRFS